MGDSKPQHTQDSDADLSFEALTFGEDDGGHARRKEDKRKPPKKDRLSPPADIDKEKSSTSSVYISTIHDSSRMDVQSLLKRLEQFGVVKASYFKEKQNFGFVQFLDSSVVDDVVEAINSNPAFLSDGVHISAEKALSGRQHVANSLLGGVGGGVGGTSLGTSFGSMMMMMPFSPSSTPTTTTTTTTTLTATPAGGAFTVTSPSNSSLSAAPAAVVEKPDTILVLKNLPFSLKQDQLQEILMAMNSTAPQSINLHFDNMGVFRGMAFIKYRQLDDAIKVYEALNGYDVGGRKVRVEYKRKNKGLQADIPVEWQEEEDLKKLWEHVREFSNNVTVNEISFMPNLSANQRKHIHAMAEKLKLTHYSSGDGDQRYICIRKMSSPAPLAGNASTLLPSSAPTTTTLLPIPISQNGFALPSPSGADPRAIDIKGRRPRRDSDHNRQVGSSPNSQPSMVVGSIEREFRPRGNSNSNSNGSGSGSGSQDWRVQSPVASMLSQSPAGVGGGGTPSSASSSSSVTIAPSRQPKGPDGSKGFGDLYRNARKHKHACAVHPFVVDANNNNNGGALEVPLAAVVV